ncbi:MAG: glycoside hydrolase family 127 protein, partial [Ruminococcaceae bacterium]|nr:glycoside hydrolase family 127 protein [Oscillospiraceae bacterium]
MKNISYRNVEIKGGYLYGKQLLNENVTINAVYNRFYDTGRIDAFNFNWTEGQDKKPHIFWDSDVAKWMEGAAYILAKKEDKTLEEKVEALIDCIEKNQQADGYFNIFYTVCEPENRFANRLMHELYCAGHLFEAAVAYFEATGKGRFLNLMDKYVDCIIKAFVTEKT